MMCVSICGDTKPLNCYNIITCIKNIYSCLHVRTQFSAVNSQTLSSDPPDQGMPLCPGDVVTYKITCVTKGSSILVWTSDECRAEDGSDPSTCTPVIRRLKPLVCDAEPTNGPEIVVAGDKNITDYLICSFHKSIFVQSVQIQ